MDIYIYIWMIIYVNENVKYTMMKWKWKYTMMILNVLIIRYEDLFYEMSIKTHSKLISNFNEQRK